MFMESHETMTISKLFMEIFLSFLLCYALHLKTAVRTKWVVELVVAVLSLYKLKDPQYA